RSALRRGPPHRIRHPSFSSRHRALDDLHFSGRPGSRRHRHSAPLCMAHLPGPYASGRAARGSSGNHLAPVPHQLSRAGAFPDLDSRRAAVAVLHAQSIGLFLLLLGILAALGGLVQIDPVWIYGPYDPVGIIPGAQPDWYLGWIEGAMRLFPGVNLHLGSYLIPGVFFPGVLFPALVFLVL